MLFFLYMFNFVKAAKCCLIICINRCCVVAIYFFFFPAAILKWIPSDGGGCVSVRAGGG